MESVGLTRAPGVVELRGRRATDSEIELIHDPEYVEATKAAGEGGDGPWARYGYGDNDNPIFPNMHGAAASIAGASIVGAEAVWSGHVVHAFSAAGGLHHAMPSRASGFCVYDDPAIAIAWLLGQGASRIAYVDLDVHHGDGVQECFWREPRVLTVSVHESGKTLFPGTGEREERGAVTAKGTKVNVPLPAGTGDRAWLRALDEIVVPAVTAWRPDVLVTQLGCDTHLTDPLAHLEITTSAYAKAARTLHDLAHDAAGGRWLATGGGGYRRVTVVPRAWTIDFAAMAQFELPEAIPESWRVAVERESGIVAPEAFMDDPIPEPAAELGSRADTAVDDARDGAFAALSAFGVPVA